MTDYTTPDDYSALDYPEDFLWVRRPDLLGEFVHRLPQCRSGSLSAIPGDRLRELYYAAAAPEDPTEEMLVRNREWLRIYVNYALGEWPITIPEAGPLPEWDQGWLLSVEC
jgi:hypothetical protein